MLELASKAKNNEPVVETGLFSIPGVPDVWRDEYVRCSNKALLMMSDLVRDIQLEAAIHDHPVDFAPIQDYLGWCKIYYIPVGMTPDIADNGEWRRASDSRILLVLHKRGLSKEERKLTIAHELMHVLQYYDPAIRDVFDEALAKGMPQELVYRMIDVTADRSALRYLMPTGSFALHARSVLKNPYLTLSERVGILAKRYSVSYQTAKNRILDYGMAAEFGFA